MDTPGQWYLIARLNIPVGQTQSWAHPDPNPSAFGNYPAPTTYNNPIWLTLASNQSINEINWPPQSYLDDNSDASSSGVFRAIEGDALLTWVVVANGGASFATTLTLPLDANPSSVFASLTSTAGMANGDYLQIDSEVVQLVDAVNGTILRAACGTVIAAHASGATVTDISAGSATDLTVVVQT
jgi:hypothetical protein